ncbi:MAG: DUF4159 domain-containing protein [Sphingomonadales bacterium]|jgi:hypothetical protein
MLQLGSLAFANPWLLMALISLPAIWLLIRAIPPVPKNQLFPAIRLLRNLEDVEPPTASTPWWLLLLRLLIAALIILALAEPIFNPKKPLPGTGPIALIMDQSWTAANQWNKAQDAALELTEEAERQDRTVLLLPTAAPAGGWREGDENQFLSPLPAREAASRLRAAEPHPWPSDLATLETWLPSLELNETSFFWVSDGLSHKNQDAVLDLLERSEKVTFLKLKNESIAFRQVALNGLDFDLSLVRADASQTVKITVDALRQDGRLLGQTELSFRAGQTGAQGRLVLPPNVRSQVARLEITGQDHAGAVYLLDASSSRPLVGLIDTDTAELRQPLRSARFYLSRALSPYSALREGNISELLDQNVSILILSDSGRLTDEDESQILAWVENGGVFLRFAGPKLASEDPINRDSDPLLPVTLRLGERAVGGALSWSSPQKLGPFSEQGPFYNLTPSDEVTVTRQVLAQPSLDLSNKTWARLEDDTPLVTAKSQGLGRIILVHTTATPDWSNLALSGTFVDMLRQILPLAQTKAVPVEKGSGLLKAERHLDGFGRLRAPQDIAGRIDAKGSIPPASARHPAGYYGSGAYNLALNLTGIKGPIDPRFEFTALGARALNLPQRDMNSTSERPLTAPLFLIALILLALDLLVSLGLRGHLKPALSVMALFLILQPVEGRAFQSTEIADGASSVQLACVESGRARIDRICMEGLTGLSLTLRRRTSVWPGDPVLVRPDNPNLGLYPVLYWPVLEDAAPLSDAAVSNISQYMQRSGLVVFDTGVGITSNRALPQDSAEIRAALTGLVGRLNLPPLEILNDQHVLSHSFYILDRFPGRLVGRQTWVEAGTRGDSGRVSTVIIGGNDWVSQWSLDRSNLNTTPDFSGGRQRELATRFGVNTVIYALTGTYKSDQVHLPALIERVGR